MDKIKKIMRRILYLKRWDILENRDFSLISSNCNGCIMLNELGLKFRSPFVNLWIPPKDFVKIVSDLNYYMDQPLEFISEKNISYPIAKLGDATIYFQHYKTVENAKASWNRRVSRINYQNIYILMTDRDGCTYQDILDFDKITIKNKIIFTAKDYENIKSTFCIKGFENCESVGMCYDFIGKFSLKRFYDQFDYIGWFNGKY